MDMDTRKFVVLTSILALAVFGFNYTMSAADTETFSPADAGDKWAEELLGDTLVNADGEKVETSTLKEMDKIAIYFSAQWCPPCRAFTPRLVDAYNEAKEGGAAVEVIFVSSDRDEDSMVKYMEDYGMEWLAVPFDGPRRELGEKFSVRGIPSLFILDGEGNIINADGRTEVMSKGSAAFA